MRRFRTICSYCFTCLSTCAVIFLPSLSGRKRYIHIVAAHGDRIGRHTRGFGKVGTDSIVEVKPPAVPQARHRATIDGTVIERRAGMRTDVFHGIKLSLMAEDGHKAIPHAEFTSLAFGDIIDTSESDHA